MSLLSALNAATSGLRVTQAGIGVVSQNVANADTAGYTRRRLLPVQLLAGDRTSGVRTGEIERVIDLVAQRQLRLETAGAAYTSLTARFASEIDRLFGQPGGNGALDSAMNGFTQALQTLLSDPASFTARSAVLDAATTLTTRIGSIASGIQGLRTDAENRIASAVTRANELLSGIAAVNAKIVSSGTQAPAPALLDERDRLINELSTFTDLQVVDGQGGSVSLMTTSGLMLFDGSSAVKLAFDGRGIVDAKAQYSTDPAQRGVGTITATTIQGSAIDAVANGMFRSGEIAAALALRDTILPQAQRQLDELAAGLSRAISDRQVTGTPAGGGLEIDLAGLKAGNAVTIDYAVGGVARRVILMPTTGGAPTPIPPADTADPNATVIRVNIAGGLSAAVADINAGFAAAGRRHRGEQPRRQRVALRAERRHDAGWRVRRHHRRHPGERLPAAPLVRRQGLRQRRLHRVLRRRLASHRLRPADRDQPACGLLDEGQQVALSAIESRFADYSGVNIDQEMALLVQLQTAYGANARVMTAVRDMLDMLMRI